MCHTAVAKIAVHNWKRTPSVTNRSPRPMEDGMRFHVVLTQVSSGGAPATNRHNPYSINPGLLDPRRHGLNGYCMSGEFL